MLGIGAELAAPDRGGSDGKVSTRYAPERAGVGESGWSGNHQTQCKYPADTHHPTRLPDARHVVNKDLILRPYQPLFFQRGSSREPTHQQVAAGAAAQDRDGETDYRSVRCAET